MLPALDFSINQGENKNLIYIKPSENAEQRITSLVLINSTHDQTIQFKDHSAPASKENYHFKLRFLHGNLDNPAQIKLQTDGWSCHYQQYHQYDYIYFLATSSVSLSAHDDKTLQLQNLFAKGDPRTTPVSLLWNDNTNYVVIPDDYGNSGSQQTVDIANYTQQVYAPLHVGFVGSNTVLNDGKSSNTLTLRLTNISKKPLTLVKGSHRATFTLHFDYDPDKNQDKEWALLDQNTANAIEMSVTHNHDSWAEASKKSEGTQPLWSFTVPQSAKPLAPYDFIDVTITGIKTAYPTGQTNLYLHTSNTPGHWDGYYTAVIEKSPLIYSGAQVGIGTNQPQHTLDVHGDAAISGQLTVGSLRELIVNGDSRLSGTLRVNSPTTLKQLTVDEDTMISGKLGIGTTSFNDDYPKLTIQSTTPTVALLFRSTDRSSGSTYYNTAKIEAGWKEGETNWNQAFIKFYTHPNGSQLSPVLTVKGANVGIGTDEPQAKLDVKGNAAISGNLTVSGGKISANTISISTVADAPNRQISRIKTEIRLNNDGNVVIGSGVQVNGSLTVGSITLTEENLKFLKGLADGTAVVNFMTQNGYIIDNYDRRHDDGDSDRTIQFSNKNSSTWSTRSNYNFNLLIAVDGDVNRWSY